MPDDRTIIDDIRTRLEADPRIPHPGEVAIEERAGTVTLRGTVGSPHQRRAAVEIARSTRHVGYVADELAIDPRDRWDDHEIRGAALRALIAHDGVPSEHVDVTVANGWMTLKGEVRHQSDSDAAYEAVRHVPGIGGMTNKIVVVTPNLNE